MTTDGPTITSLELEDRRFPPPAGFAAQANADGGPLRAGRGRSRGLLARAGQGAARPGSREPTQGCDGSNPPFFKWFADGTLNASVNCLDRHVDAARRPGRLPLAGRGGRARRRSPTATCTSGSAASPTGCGSAASARATWWRSTCR